MSSGAKVPSEQISGEKLSYAKRTSVAVLEYDYQGLPLEPGLLSWSAPEGWVTPVIQPSPAQNSLVERSCRLTTRKMKDGGRVQCHLGERNAQEGPR